MEPEAALVGAADAVVLGAVAGEHGQHPVVRWIGTDTSTVVDG